MSDESMVSAINAVREGRMIASVAARSYGVPPSTLKDRISGSGTKPGPVPHLTEAEEEELVEFLKKSNN